MAYYKKRAPQLSTGGGVSILVKNNIHSNQIMLRSNFEVLAVVVYLPRKLTILNIYIPPTQQFSEIDLQNIIYQLPTPYIITGDFNAHNIIWGSIRTDAKGRCIEKLLDSDDIVIANNGANTHINISNGSESVVDLTFLHTSLMSIIDWSVLPDLYGSDHYPILLKIFNNTINNNIKVKWKFNSADWQEYQSLINNSLKNFEVNSDINEDILVINKTIQSAAKRSIPRTITKAYSPSVPWWNKECRVAMREYKSTFYQFKKTQTPELLNKYKRLRAKSRYIIKQNKKKTWEAYLSEMTSNTPVKEVWHKIRRIRGVNINYDVSALLNENNILVTDKNELSEIFAEHYEAAFSTASYSNEFIKIKAESERAYFKTSIGDDEPYNMPFNTQELSFALEYTKNTSPGADGIFYIMIKNLPESGKEILLNFYNKIWNTGELPKIWKESCIIPILKPKKVDTNVKNYRPIALTSCMGKILEKIVSNRLKWVLEGKKLLNNTQCGFRKGNSTTDLLVNIETNIRNAFLKKEHLIAVFLDIEQAYDRTWRHKILMTLEKWSIKGNMFKYIQAFLNDRSFKVQLGNNKSRTHPQENGVPQGSVLSVLLFLISINDIDEQISYPIKICKFADDILVYSVGKNKNQIQVNLQSSLNKIQKWTKNNGFTLSISKTKCMKFCKCRFNCSDPALKLESNGLEYVNVFKYLGMIIDKRLTWVPHIKYIKANCTRNLNLLKTIAHYNWGADRQTLMKVFKSLIRSRIEYGSVVYMSANNNALSILKILYNAGLRIVLGAFRTSPIISLYNESGELPPELRRDQALLKYASKIYSNPAHLNHNIVCFPNFTNLYAQHTNCLIPATVRLNNLKDQLNIDLKVIVKSKYTIMPPWNIRIKNVDLELTKLKKSETTKAMYKQHFNEIIDKKYKDYEHIYTDGSQLDNGNVGCAFIYKNTIKRFKMPMECSVFNSELYAIWQAAKYALNEKSQKFLILVDSLSALQSIQQMNPQNQYSQNIQELNKILINKGSTVQYMWVPSHSGVSGNEIVDEEAKNAAVDSDAIIEGCIILEDFVKNMNNLIKNKWGQQWFHVDNNKLRSIKTGVDQWFFPNDRQHQKIITRLRIGHTKITHVYLMEKKGKPNCDKCQCELSVKHILYECMEYNQERSKCKINRDFNSEENIDKILKFLKLTKLLNEI